MTVPVQPVTIPAPGIYGLNTQGDVNSDTFDWAVTADNITYDEFGRMTSRKGWQKLTTTPIGGSPNVEQVWEYKVNANTSVVVSAANNRLFHGTVTLTDITGTLMPTGNNWQFQNFNGSVVGWQTGHTPIVWSNTGNFANLAVNSGTQPDGPACLSAFGRMWAFDDDRTTLRYSALLDATRWDVVDGGGSIDLRSSKSAPHSGIDFGVALAEFNGHLIVLMTSTIIVYTGATDPTTMSIQDLIPGMGCSARDSVQNIGNDLVWLDRNGVVGLVRALEGGDMPIRAYTTRVRDEFLSEMFSSGAGTVRSCYNKKDGFYAISAYPFVWAFDTKFPLQDGTLRVSKWNGIAPRSWHFASDNELYIGKEGVIGKYNTHLDNTSMYSMRWTSNWSRLQADQLKFIKQVEAILAHTGQYQITFSLGYDYVTSVFTSSATSGTAGGVSEYAIAEWGIGQWGASKNHNRVRAAGGRSGLYVQVGISVGINNVAVSIQNLRLLLKLGRTSR